MSGKPTSSIAASTRVRRAQRSQGVVPQGLGTHISSFALNIDGLRDFVDLVEPVLAGSSMDVVSRNASSLLPLVAAFSLLPTKHKGALSSMPKPSPEQMELIRKDFDLEVTRDNGREAVVITSRGGATGRRFDDATKELFRRLRHHEHLYTTALVSLISSVECFFSGMLHAYYADHIEAIGTSEKQFSLKELEAFKTLDDAREAVIDNKVESLLWQGFEDWVQYLRNHLKLTAGYLDPVMDEMTEVFLRRNIHVHNNGIVNSIYLSKVTPPLAENIKGGQGLPVTREYLDRAIDLFELYFILLASELWKKLKKGDHERTRLLIDISYERMLGRRWNVAGGISRFVSEDKSAVEHDRTIGTVNYWQCMKWSGKFDEVKVEVENADFSGKSVEFRLCLHALRGEADAFFELLPRALKSEALTVADLRVWPVFQEMRKRAEFDRFLHEETAPKPTMVLEQHADVAQKEGEDRPRGSKKGGMPRTSA